MKKYIKIMLAIAFVSYTSASFADITHEDCTTWVYSSYYAWLWTCNTCGYHNTRFYRGQSYWLWDYFVNINKKNYLVSTNSANSYAKIHNLQANMNYTVGSYVGTNTAGLTANYLPDTAGINGNRDAVIFLMNNVSWNQNLTNRNTPIWIVEYNLRHYEITSTGTATANTNYAYLMGTEVLGGNGLYNLQTTWINSSGVKNYDPTPLNHKECYVMLWAWCGDGVIDTWGWETCDNGAANGTFWNACSATCQPRTCANGWVSWVQATALTGSTAGLCQPGITVSSFTGTRVGNTTNYTWMCDGLAGANCAANWTSTCTNGWLSGVQTSVVLPTTPWLCQSWVTLGAFTWVTVWTTTNYSWTCDGYTGAACTASYSSVAPQCQNGWVWGSQSSTISSSTAWLCQSGTTVWNFVSSVAGNTTSYSWTCNGIAWGNCSATYTNNPWGWGSSDYCYGLTATNTSWNIYSFSCSWNRSDYTIDIRETTSGANKLLHTFTNNWGSYTFTRNGTYTAQCYVWVSNTTDLTTCKRTISFWSTSGNYCWDGDIWNYNSTSEQCDFGWWTWPSWCDRTTCKIIEDTSPGAYNLKFEPEWDILLWDGMSIFGNLSTSFATFTNNTASDVYIPGKVCVYKNNKTYNVITGNSICSSNQIGFVWKSWWVKKVGISNDQFVGETANIPAGKDFWEAELITTLEWLQNKDTFLKSVLNVRVAKPTVNTLGWGASVLNGSTYSDVNTLAGWGFSLLKPEFNKNLILTSLWINPLSSYVKSSSNSTLLSASKAEWNKEMSSFDKIDNNLNSYAINRLPTEKFNSLENVYIHKGNVTLGAQSISGWNQTFIIDGWNLTINGNLTSTNNILFVVRNGNVVISNNVTNIDAIIIDIWWNVVWESTSTLNRLVINGALYGDVSDLLSKRTYIKDRWAYVDVGTNINFTSKIFDAPPPLLSKFLWEYTDVLKVPK